MTSGTTSGASNANPNSEAPGKAGEPRHAEAGEGAEHEREGGRHHRDFEARQRRGAKCFVM